MLSLNNIVFSQSNYNLGYSKGFRYACNCEYLPPKAFLLNQGTYESGFNDGKLDGLIYLQKQQTIQQTKNQSSKPTTVYRPNYDILEKTLQQKQQLLNQRRLMIQSEYQNVSDIIIAANSRNKLLTSSQVEYIKWFMAQADVLTKYDLSIDANYYNVYNWFQDVKQNVLKW